MIGIRSAEAMIDAAYPSAPSDLLAAAYAATQAVEFDEWELAGLEIEARAAGFNDLRVALFGLRILVARFPHEPARIRQCSVMRNLRTVVGELRGEVRR